MYAQAAKKQNILLRNGAYGIVMRGVQKCTCAGSSLRGSNFAPLCCIKLDTATEPAMGSAAFLNEAINQLAESYIDRKQKELGEMISANERMQELQKVKMYIADNNVFGVDLNPVAVELAEVSLWLNTIYEGGLVPWFGEQLVNGNSLIGAKRQVYHKNQLTATAKGLRWYENAPERIPFLRLDASGRNIARSRYQVYHFLIGDPGMCSYNAQVIKALETDNIQLMKKWNKRFTSPYSEDEFKRLIELSKIIDVLWREQIKARKTLVKETADALDIYGHKDKRDVMHRTIREKDRFLRAIYKSEHAKNAGAYARLKFAMDYWCALWFWPINKADMLPGRDEYINDMDLILNGVMETEPSEEKQLSFFNLEDEDEPVIRNVDLDQLCTLFPRMALVKEIAEKNHFMHWELEFADLFAERGGFDLVIGNPPWVNVDWNENNALSDQNPLFVIKRLTATQTTSEHEKALLENKTRNIYFNEYEFLAGQQNYINATQNYMILKGHRSNLYKCFLPQGWSFVNKNGICAYIHPKGVFEDSKGEMLRSELNTRARGIYRFTNAEGLFHDVHRQTDFAICIYGSKQKTQFDMICSLTNPLQIDELYGKEKESDRIIHINQKTLHLFSKMLDGNDNWAFAKLPDIGFGQIIDVLMKFSEVPLKLAQMQNDVYYSDFWNETIDQNDGYIHTEQKGKVSICHFPETLSATIYSAANIGSLNSCGFSTRREYKVSSDYDRVDLTVIPEDYIVRCRYSPGITMDKYRAAIPESPWGKITDFYRIVSREFVGCDNERTLTWFALRVARQVYHMIFLLNVSARDILTRVHISYCPCLIRSNTWRLSFAVF